MKINKMTHDSNTSQFVKTYGKPRLTQRLGQDSFWHDELTDDFDRVMAIEDVRHTTFISPEPVGSVTICKNTIQKNKTNTVGGWSNYLQSTLTGHKSVSTQNGSVVRTNKQNPSSKKAEIKKKDHITNTSFSSDTDSDISSNYKVTPRFICKSSKKAKKLFNIPRNQCSTPFQRSLFTCGRTLNGNSSTKNMKKTKLKTKAKYTFTTSHTPKLSKKLDFSHVNVSNSESKAKENYNQFEQSKLMSGSGFPLNSKNKPIQYSMPKNLRTYKQLSIKPSKTNKGKTNTLSNSEKHSNWYNDVKNIFQSEKNITQEKSLENNEIPCVKMSLEHKKKVSDKNSSSEEEYGPTIIFNKSNKNNSCDKHNVIEMRNKTFETPNLSGEDESDDSLYLSCHVNENKMNESTNSSKYVYMNEVNDKNVVDSPSIINCHSSQPSPCLTPSYNNSGYLIQNYVESSLLNSSCSNTNELYTESHGIESPSILKPKEDNKQKISEPQIMFDTRQNIYDLELHNELKQYNLLSNLSSDKSTLNYSYTSSLDVKIQNVLKQKQSNKPTNCVNFKESEHLLAKKTSLQSNDNVLNASESAEPQIMLDNLHNSSDVKFHDEIKQRNDSSNLSLDKSTFNCSVLKESNIYGSSSSEQDTVIDKQKENNVGSTDLQEKSTHPLKTLNNCPNNEQLLNFKISNDTSITHDQNPESKLFNSKSSISNTEKSQSNYDPCDLFYKFSNADTFYTDIPCITYEKLTTAKDQTETYINTSDINLEETNVSKNISRRKRYANRFENGINLNSIKETINENETGFQNSSQGYPDCSQSMLSQHNITGFRLEPGKKWRRSLLIVRNYKEGNLDQTTNFAEITVKGRKWNSTVDDVLRQQTISTGANQTNEQSIILSNQKPHFYQRYSEKPSTDLENEIYAKKYIFEKCNQEEPISFESWLKPNIQKTWKKVGEGVYGEVFSYIFGKNSTVVKIIPIEGENYINSERQKMMFEVYSEILIAVELNKLFDKNSWNHTKSFCKLKNISCVVGKYPKQLIELWNDYNDKKGSDNDNPYILPDTQMFMVLEMEDGGVDVENFLFHSASQALSAFLQIVFGLAIAEYQFNFEHRDLHIGNILVKKVSAKTVSFKLNGETFNIRSRGVKITVIDFTLSRLTHRNKPVYNDLSKDIELFTSDGDYQFEIYRLMKKETNDQWNSYKPKTNIYWLHYVLDKMVTSVRYKNTSTATHFAGIKNLLKIKNAILDFDSVKIFAESSFISDFV